MSEGMRRFARGADIGLVCAWKNSRQTEQSGEASLGDTWKTEKTEPLETEAGKGSKVGPGSNSRSLIVS